MKTLELQVSDKSTMRTYVAEPDGKGPFPGLVVLQEAFGVNSHIQSLVKRFAKEGFVAIAPELYHRTAQPGHTVGYDQFQAITEHFSAITTEGQIADVQACYDWLTQKAKVTGVATIGYCMGGRASFVANSQVPLKAAVSYYGGRIVPTLLPLAAEQKSPIMMIWGGLDANIPPEQTRAIADALTGAKKKFVDVTFSDAGHGFSCDERPSYNAMATRQAWALSLQFLRDHLG